MNQSKTARYSELLGEVVPIRSLEHGIGPTNLKFLFSPSSTMIANGTTLSGSTNGPSSIKANFRHMGPLNILKCSKFALLTLYFSVLLFCFVVLVASFISLQSTARSNSMSELKFPFHLAELQALDASIMKLRELNPIALFSFFSALYIAKQTFSIPGSVILNLIAGRIYSTYFAFPLVCTLTMVGASSCYVLSKTLAKRALMLCCSERIKSTGKSMESHKSDLLWYMTFLRLIPMSPNWLINVTAPIVGVPFGVFSASVLIGLMPYNFICVQAGSILSTIHSMEDIFTTWTLVKLGSLAILAMIPIVVKRILLRRQRQMEPVLPR